MPRNCREPLGANLKLPRDWVKLGAWSQDDVATCNSIEGMRGVKQLRTPHLLTAHAFSVLVFSPALKESLRAARAQGIG